MLVSCQSNQEIKSKRNEAIEIDIDEATILSQPLKLSEIASTIEYIPLETSPESLLSNYSNFSVTDKYILVSQNGQIKQFDKSGRFIRNLVKVGRGPGEGFSRCLVIDDSGENLYMYSNFAHKIMQYNLKNGENYNSIADPEPESFTENIFHYRNCLVLIFSNSSEKHFFKIYSLENNEFLLEWPIKYQLSDRSFNSIAEYSTAYFQKYSDTLLFKEMFSDTLYQTTDFEDLQTRYIFKGGKKLTYEAYHQFLSNPGKNNIDNKLIIGRFLETKNSLFFYGYSQNRSKIYLYDKTKNNLKAYPGKEIVNDLDNGPKFKINWRPHSTIHMNNRIFCMLDPFIDIEPLNKRNVKSEKATELIKKINKNSNPILMVAKLKE